MQGPARPPFRIEGIYQTNIVRMIALFHGIQARLLNDGAICFVPLPLDQWMDKYEGQFYDTPSVTHSKSPNCAKSIASPPVLASLFAN